MQCPQCREGELRNVSPGRALQFTIFTLVLLGIGGLLHLAGVALWPWVFYIAAGFVFSQVLVKVIDESFHYCTKCEFRGNIWPWTKGK